MSLPAVRQKAMEIALGEVGVREEGGNNCGPRVEQYLAVVGLPPGKPWCCALVVWAYREAVLRCTGDHLLPLRRTGRVARLWATARPLWRSNEPTVGAIFIHLLDPDDPDSDGHCGIVTRVRAGSIDAVEGNTNRAGSRVGGQVLLNPRERSYVHGYIDVGREGPLESPAIS